MKCCELALQQQQQEQEKKTRTTNHSTYETQVKQKTEGAREKKSRCRTKSHNTKS